MVRVLKPYWSTIILTSSCLNRWFCSRWCYYLTVILLSYVLFLMANCLILVMLYVCTLWTLFFFSLCIKVILFLLVLIELFKSIVANIIIFATSFFTNLVLFSLIQLLELLFDSCFNLYILLILFHFFLFFSDAFLFDLVAEFFLVLFLYF